MTNATQAPRPAAADTEAAWQAVRAMRLAASIAGTDAERADLREWADAHLALAADLDATRAERDAAIEARRSIQAHCYGGQDLPDAISRAERAEAERDAARATVREWIAANGPGGWIDDLRKAAPVPAADVPPFLLARVQ